jgi:hypothetical protein
MPGFNPGALNVSGTLPALNTFPSGFSPPFAQSLFTFGGNRLASTLPDLRTPYVTNWSFGIQRELGKRVVVEARYVGNKGTHIWHAFNQNETNIFENGFLQEFVNAQNNLSINSAAGVNSFANRGLAGQVPLPIFQTAFGALGTRPALSNAQSFGNGTFINQLRQGQAGAMANAMAGSAVYLCRMVGSGLPACANQGYNVAGPYPINFFQMNPFFAGQEVRLQTDSSFSTYNGLQIEVRRASRGFAFNASYTFSKSLGDFFAESGDSFLNFTTIRNRGLDKAPNVFDQRHAFVGYASVELPFGAGRAFDSGNRVVNGFIGGWTLSSIVRVQSGRPFKLSSGRNTFNQMDAGVILNGMTTSELQDQLLVRDGPNRNKSFVDASLVGPDGRANPAILGTPTAPGQLGQFIYLYGPRLVMTDMAVTKQIPITERFKLEFLAEALNVFNLPTFMVGGCSSFLTFCNVSQGVSVNINSTTFGQGVGLSQDPRNIQLRLLLRF